MRSIGNPALRHPRPGSLPRQRPQSALALGVPPGDLVRFGGQKFVMPDLLAINEGGVAFLEYQTTFWPSWRREDKTRALISKRQGVLAVSVSKPETPLQINGRTLAHDGHQRWVLKPGTRFKVGSFPEITVPDYPTRADLNFGVTPVGGKVLEQVLRFPKHFELGAHQTILDGYRTSGDLCEVFDDQGLFITVPPKVILIDRQKDATLATLCEQVKSLTKGQTHKTILELLQKQIDGLFTKKTDPALKTLPIANPLYMGDYIQNGKDLCLYRALLVKLLGDEAGLKVSTHHGMVQWRGFWHCHAWNRVHEFSSQKQPQTVDISMYPNTYPTKLLPANDPNYRQYYVAPPPEPELLDYL